MNIAIAKRFVKGGEKEVNSPPDKKKRDIIYIYMSCVGYAEYFSHGTLATMPCIAKLNY